MEETMTMMNNNEVAHSDTSSENENDVTDDIPTIVVDPVDDGREVKFR